MKLAIIFTLFSLALSVPVQAQKASGAKKTQNLYRYTNSEGVTVIATNLPPGSVDSGYEIIDRHGRILEVFSPKLSDEGKASLRKEEAKLKQIEARRTRDFELLQQYSSTDEARNEMERRIDEIKVQIELLDGAALRAQKSLDKKNEHADRIKAAGREVNDQLAGEISASEQGIAKILREKNKLDKDIEHTRYSVEKDIKRLAVLLKHKKITTDTKHISDLSDTLLQGEWRNRDNFWLDWDLEENGRALIRSQVLGTSERTESFGTWKLKGSQIVFLINQRKVTTSRGSTDEYRVSEEKLATVLEADKRKLQVVFNGNLMTLTRP
ncbi:hypothetical protein EOPP23_09700 [Endozoicomonas sp. OPT23]|uniref:hypothetical protein n=1 Tax=Endozoicomonas sp. OPT23 TaxID=2072845 RepID=UPI00129AF5C8|nr:hypothetical protein [Endozoicomonas sp. OPT23]MRI33255.1 hypothetical protein [Endozoicomonas sp. OPT23]